MTAINYACLEQLLKIPGLHRPGGADTTPEAHAQFMRLYQGMILDPNNKKGPLPIENGEAIVEGSTINTIAGTGYGGLEAGKGVCEARQYANRTPESHDIKDHLINIRKPRMTEALRGKDLWQNVASILRKMPYERVPEENDKLYELLVTYEPLIAQVDRLQLKELAVHASMEVYPIAQTIFGSSGFHVIISGSVRTLTRPYVQFVGDAAAQLEEEGHVDSVPSLDKEKLSCGDCFGTLNETEHTPSKEVDRTRLLLVETIEEETKVVKFSAIAFRRACEAISERQISKKVSLIQACPTYTSWSRQAVIKVANLIRWKTYPANSVLVSEGYPAPFIGYLKSGTLSLARSIKVKEILKNKKERVSTKQVILMRLDHGCSFGENSCIANENMMYTLITESSCVLGLIDRSSLYELNESILTLLAQTEETRPEWTDEQVYTEFVSQEKKRQWSEKKHQVIMDTINERGINPGVGKWAR